MNENRPRLTKQLAAIAALVGSTIGIGFLGLPYTFSRAGTGMGILLLVVVYGLFLLNNLIYGEIVLRTHFRHQYVGYVRKYLGRYAEKFSLFTFWITVYGSTIGVLIISGQFMSQLLLRIGLNVSPEILSTFFFIVAVVLVYRGLKTVSVIDFVVLFFVLLVIAIVAITGIREITGHNYIFATGRDHVMPFGVALFALSGLMGIPLARELLIGQERKLKTAIFWGTTIPAAFYLFFATVIVGISGVFTSEAAFVGLDRFLGGGVVTLGLFVGLSTCTTIFISGTTAFKESLAQDFKLRRKQDFILFILPAYVFFVFGVSSFIKILGLIGGVAVSLDMILLQLVYIRAKRNGERIPEYSIRLPNAVIYAMMLVFAATALYTLFLG